jgi:putative ABC transport system substrate-binding protein
MENRVNTVTRRSLTILGVGVSLSGISLAHAQSQVRPRRVGILWGGAENSGPGVHINTFTDALKELGWSGNGTIEIEKAWGNNEEQEIKAGARKLVAWRPDVILAGPTVAVLPLKELVQNIPIVFVSVSDPIGSGIVDTLSRPKGNLTGFTNVDLSLVGKWIQLLKTVAPDKERMGMMISTINPVSARFFGQFEQLASKSSFEAIRFPVSTFADVQNALRSLRERGSCALIIPGDTFLSRGNIRTELLQVLSDLSLPTIFGDHDFTRVGGLMSYGFDPRTQFRSAALYVSRILRGELVENLPVQQPTKYELIVNLATAKKADLSIPPVLLALAEELI